MKEPRIQIVFGSALIEPFFQARFIVRVTSFFPNQVISDLKWLAFSHKLEFRSEALGGFLFSKTFGILGIGEESNVKSFIDDVQRLISKPL